MLQLESASHQGVTFAAAHREFSLTASSSLHSTFVLQSLLHIADPTHQVSILLRCTLMNWGSRKLKHLAIAHSSLSKGSPELHKTELSDSRSVLEQRQIQNSHPS